MHRRLMLAISGGVPPDVAGVAGRTLPAYAEANALTPLDRLAARHGIARGQSLDVLWQICSCRGHLWALATTPGCLASIWNKKLFREAGLDPEQPPRSIAELEQFDGYVNSQKPMEKLCLGQRKFSPLRGCSPEFFAQHPNPYIARFLELAKSPDAHYIPPVTTWPIYSNDLIQAFESIWSGKTSARESLVEVQQHVQGAANHHEQRWERVSSQRPAEWSKQ